MRDMLNCGTNEQFSGLFRATPEKERTFCRPQQAFTTALMLVHFDLDKPIQLEANSSGFVIAGIMSQPVAQARPKVLKKAPTPGMKVA